MPYRLLQTDEKLSAGDPDAGNLLVQGDNLEALKALLPYYAGQVKCIYIDPPYNTGNEGWVYNDNVNSPEIRKWLDKTVGKEGEDLSRHDKWLCMMYPRLAILREFLRQDGVIFISIDDNEVHELRLLMDEIFGTKNFVATIIWQKKHSPQNDAINLSDMHDYILVYAKRAKTSRDDPNGWNRNLLPISDERNKRYKNPDNDPRGPWASDNYTCNKTVEERPNLYYPIINPNTGEEIWPSRVQVWRYEKSTHEKNLKENRIHWGATGRSRPRYKRFLADLHAGGVTTTWWPREFAGDNQEARRELRLILGRESMDFTTPKPVRLIDKIIKLSTNPGDIILDSFAGSGTTAHAVLQNNKDESQSRKFICVEMDEQICHQVTSKRIKSVCEGYKNDKGENIKGLGSGFRYCHLGTSLFDEHGNIASEVRFTDLARHVYFTETGVPIPKQPRKNCPLLGVYQGTAYYLLYNGVLGDKRPDGGNVLTSKVLALLPEHPAGSDPKVIYGEACRIGTTKLKNLGIEFKQLPYQIKTD